MVHSLFPEASDKQCLTDLPFLSVPPSQPGVQFMVMRFSFRDLAVPKIGITVLNNRSKPEFFFLKRAVKNPCFYLRKKPGLEYRPDNPIFKTCQDIPGIETPAVFHSVKEIGSAVTERRSKCVLARYRQITQQEYE